MHLIKGLLAWGFHQSTVDPCLFICSNCIIVVYTDDCCIFGLNNQAIDTLLASLSEEFVLHNEGTIKNYLGINTTKVQKPSTGNINITFTRTGLINSILSDLKLISTDSSHEPWNPANPQATPMAKVVHPNPDAEPYDPQDAPYWSLIGKLNFLAQHTQPNIAYAVNSCAHYLNAPNKTHFTAMKWIGCYLLGTWDKGLILHLTNKNHLVAYINSDFSGLWSKQLSHLCHSALSHTGCHHLLRMPHSLGQ